MLKLFYSLRDLDFPALMNVYSQSNDLNGQENWPDEPAGVQLLLAEQEFRNYLREVFFPTEGSVYAVWEERGRYVSALRLEPYRDGLLIAGLETSPEFRQMGFASALLSQVQSRFPGRRLYSHIGKDNDASAGVHTRCGFKKILDYAAYVDGSVSRRAATFLFES